MEDLSMSVIWIDDEPTTARRAYRVYEKGVYVGTLILSLEEVRAYTAKAVYILKPATHNNR
jgi:hypothetical protein